MLFFKYYYVYNITNLLYYYIFSLEKFSMSNQWNICGCRCQTLEQELAKTRHEMEALDRQLQHAAKQKYLLQEKLCNFEVGSL